MYRVTGQTPHNTARRERASVISIFRTRSRLYPRAKGSFPLHLRQGKHLSQRKRTTSTCLFCPHPNRLGKKTTPTTSDPETSKRQIRQTKESNPVLALFRTEQQERRREKERKESIQSAAVVNYRVPNILDCEEIFRSRLLIITNYLYRVKHRDRGSEGRLAQGLTPKCDKGNEEAHGPGRLGVTPTTAQDVHQFLEYAGLLLGLWSPLGLGHVGTLYGRSRVRCEVRLAVLELCLSRPLRRC